MIKATNKAYQPKEKIRYSIHTSVQMTGQTSGPLKATGDWGGSGSKLNHLQINVSLWPNLGIRHIIKSRNIFVNLSVCV